MARPLAPPHGEPAELALGAELRRSRQARRGLIGFAPQAAVARMSTVLPPPACLRTRLLLAAATVLFAPCLSPDGAEALADAAEHYRPMMIEQIDQSLAGARLLRDRLAAGDLEGAKAAWIDARVGWERAEVFTSGFVPDLDREIDAWPNAVLGFHAIEAKLFGAKRTDVQQETDALILHLEDLDVKVKHLQLLPQRLLNGIARLSYEVGESKAAGGESSFSGTSLNDMRNNVEGIELAYQTIFREAVEERDPKLGAAVEAKISQLKALVEVPSLKDLDPEKLRAASEELIVVLQTAAPEIGLRPPSLEEIAQ